MFETFAPLNISIANDGIANTYQKAGMGSIIDITFVSTTILRNTRWWVSEEFTNSDRQAIIFEIKERNCVRPLKQVGPKWKAEFLDEDTFKEVLYARELPDGSAEYLTKQLIRIVTTLCLNA